MHWDNDHNLSHCNQLSPHCYAQLTLTVLFSVSLKSHYGNVTSLILHNQCLTSILLWLGYLAPIPFNFVQFSPPLMFHHGQDDDHHHQLSPPPL